MRKVTKCKPIFPTDDSLLKILYLAMINATSKWTQIEPNSKAKLGLLLTCPEIKVKCKLGTDAKKIGTRP